VGRPVRNPLTAALTAMAVHTGIALLLGWPFPSVATFLAGTLAVPWAVVRAPPPGSAIGGAAGFVALVPGIVPPAILAAGAAAFVATKVPVADDPFRNSLLALPALTFLALCFTV